MSSTGIAGLTLGGGLGWLDRLCGPTCDNLLAAEVVTADGQVVQADADEHPDLYWALRGGGGNFGVVTAFRYRLHPVAGVVSGLLGYPIDRAAGVLRALRDLIAAAPDRLTVNAVLTSAPPLPFVPADLHGWPILGLVPVVFGSPEQAEPLVAPLRALRPALDTVAPTRYTDLQQQIDGAFPTRLHHYYTAEWLRELDDTTIDRLLTIAGEATSALSLVGLKPMGGATARLPADAAAFAYRHAAYNMEIHAQWPADSPPEPHIAWTRNARHAGRHASAGGGYINFLHPDQGAERIRAAYGPHYDRLTQVKAAYDPDNVFHINNNIPPAG